jgi:hypothetical protein
MHEHRVVDRRIRHLRHKTHRAKRRLVRLRDDKMIRPFEKFRARLVVHALREARGQTVFREERVDVLREQRLRGVGERPVEIFRGVQGGHGQREVNGCFARRANEASPGAPSLFRSAGATSLCTRRDSP